MDDQKSPKKFYRRWWFWLGVIVVVVIVIAASSGSPKTSVPAAPDSTGSTAAAPEQAQTSASTASQTLLDISGNGIKSTQTFTAAGAWDIDWSYDCSSLGTPKGNFIISVFNGDGSMSFNNAPLSQLGKSDSGVQHYHTGGTFYLEVNSECSWTVKVIG